MRQSETSGIHVQAGPLRVGGSPDEATLDFACTLELNGSNQLRFAPLGDNTEVRLRGNWPDPSFQGRWLPVERQVRPDGFDATWRIPHLGRNYPRSWRAGSNAPPIVASRFGIDLLTPVDAYRQTERSLKYQVLFLGLTFTVIWLFEVLGGLRLHVIQYGLIGGAMCIFYLLELSLAEHLGFPAAYSIAAAGGRDRSCSDGSLWLSVCAAADPGLCFAGWFTWIVRGACRRYVRDPACGLVQLAPDTETEQLTALLWPALRGPSRPPAILGLSM